MEVSSIQCNEGSSVRVEAKLAKLVGRVYQGPFGKQKEFILLLKEVMGNSWNICLLPS